MEREPTAEELAEWHRRWEAVGPSRVAEALLSGRQNPLVDDDALLRDGRLMITRPHAQAWLDNYTHNEKERERRARRTARFEMAMIVIATISAIIAAIPVVQGWFAQ